MNEPDDDKFTDEERTTANLRLRSVSPLGRTLLGFFIFIPPAWRGPVAISSLVILAYLLIRIGPAAFQWIRQ